MLKGVLRTNECKQLLILQDIKITKEQLMKHNNRIEIIEIESDKEV